MKKLSLLIALCMLISIGGVYATWVYSQSDDVMDITGAKAITMTEATSTGTYGTYTVDTQSLVMKVDPAVGTTHDTALKIEGNIVIKFVPNVYAPESVKNNAVPSTFAFSLSNENWTYEGQKVLTVDTTAYNIEWESNDDGSFTYTIDAQKLAEYIQLTVFTLDTKIKYDAFDKVLTYGQVIISVSDGKSSSSIVTE